MSEKTVPENYDAIPRSDHDTRVQRDRVIADAAKAARQGTDLSKKEVGFPVQKHIDAGILPDQAEFEEILESLGQPPPAKNLFAGVDASGSQEWSRLLFSFAWSPPVHVLSVTLDVGDEIVNNEGVVIATVKTPSTLCPFGSAYVDVDMVSVSDNVPCGLKKAPYVGCYPGMKQLTAREVLASDEARGMICQEYAKAVRDGSSLNTGRFYAERVANDPTLNQLIQPMLSQSVVAIAFAIIKYEVDRGFLRSMFAFAIWHRVNLDSGEFFRTCIAPGRRFGFEVDDSCQGAVQVPESRRQ